METAKATTGSILVELLKPIRSPHVQDSRIRHKGEQAVVLRKFRDSLGRTMMRIVFDDGGELVVLDDDVAIVTGELPETPEARPRLTIKVEPWPTSLEMGLYDLGGEG